MDKKGLKMNVILKRVAKKNGYTIGKLYIEEQTGGKCPDGEELTYLTDTLEPKWRDLKGGAHNIKGKTAIPDGRYPLAVTYSKKAGKWLPLLLGVPGFKDIRICCGNTPQDTDGCILLGENKKKGMVLNSRMAMKQFMQLLVNKRKPGEGTWITVS